MSIHSQVQKLNEMIAGSQRFVVFTGAGISAESGIPTYRGDDGLWHSYDPSKYADFTHFQQDSSYYWHFFQEVRYPVIQNARPNKAHEVLARLQEKGTLSAIITQNIDGLHQEAGAGKVLELHGNTRRIFCLNCGIDYTMTSVFTMLSTQLPPKCGECGGALRPGVVFFGESLPAAVLDEAVKETEACDLFLVVGSSLVVQPAAGLPVMAKRNRAKVVIVNREPTPLDTMADLVMHSTASDVLGAL
ncbi:MAG: NAD-dependent deacylase [Pseudomonadota bacterium]